MNIEQYAYLCEVPVTADIVVSDQTNESLIGIFDGSQSMENYYDDAVEAYNQCFTGVPNIQAFQFSSVIGNISPFHNKGTNIQLAFDELVKRTLNGQLKKNLTIMFVSDGDHDNNLQALNLDQFQTQCTAIQSNFQIQFISIAVGDDFPTHLSNKMRTLLHNGSATIPAILEVPKSDDPFLVNTTKLFVPKFLTQFQKVKAMMRQTIPTNIEQQILKYPWDLTTTVKPGEVFATKDEFITHKGVKFVTHCNSTATQQYINSTMQHLLQLMSAKHPKSQEMLTTSIQFMTSIRSNLDSSGAIHKIQLYCGIGKSLRFLLSLQNGTRRIETITDQELRQIMVANSPAVQASNTEQSKYTQELLAQASKIVPTLTQAELNHLTQIITDHVKQIVNERSDLRKDIVINLIAQNNITQFLNTNIDWAFEFIDSLSIKRWT